MRADDLVTKFPLYPTAFISTYCTSTTLRDPIFKQNESFLIYLYIFLFVSSHIKQM